MDAKTAGPELDAMASGLNRLEIGQALASVRQLAIQDMGRGFATKTSPDGQPWAPLKGKYPPGKRMLVDTGAMLGGVLGRNAGTSAELSASTTARFHTPNINSMAPAPFLLALSSA